MEYLKRSGVRNGSSRIQEQLEKDGGSGSRQKWMEKWSVTYASLGVTRHKSSHVVFNSSNYTNHLLTYSHTPLNIRYIIHIKHYVQASSYNIWQQSTHNLDTFTIK